MTTYYKLDSPQGLIVVYSELGPNLTEEEFNNWYDHEHIPSRIAVPGVLNASRYKASDTQVPSWLALYDLSSLTTTTHGTEHNALGPNAPERDKQIIAGLSMASRRVYDHVLSYAHPKTELSSSSLPGKFVFIARMRVTPEGEDEFNKWCDEEHIPLLSKVPGWLRGRRYKLVEATSHGVSPEPGDEKREYLVVHDLENPEFVDRREFKEATHTSWTGQVMETIQFREFRLFERYKVFTQGS